MPSRDMLSLGVWRMGLGKSFVVAVFAAVFARSVSDDSLKQSSLSDIVHETITFGDLFNNVVFWTCFSAEGRTDLIHISIKKSCCVNNEFLDPMLILMSTHHIRPANTLLINGSCTTLHI